MAAFRFGISRSLEPRLQRSNRRSAQSHAVDTLPSGVPFQTPNDAHTLSISCTKSVISCKASHFVVNKLYGIHKHTVFFHHIVIVYIRNYHNMVKINCLEALHEKKKLKPCMRSLISCMRCSVYVHHNTTRRDTACVFPPRPKGLPDS